MRINRTIAVALTIAVAVGCQASSAPVPVERAYAVAVERCEGGDDDGALEALQVALSDDPTACQRALLEPTFHNGLRDTDAFRQAIHDAAVTHAIDDLTLVGEDEPGEWIEVECLVVDQAGDPLPGAIVRLFATAADGRYHPTIDGERTPRIFGTLVANEQGRMTFRTVRPGPYPETRNARHIHLGARAGDLRLAAPGYVVFDDDPLLDEPQNAEQRGEALRIEMADDGHGTLTLPMQ